MDLSTLNCTILIFHWTLTLQPRRNLVIAQLVERWTVEVQKSSIGHWFDSGSRDCNFFLYVDWWTAVVQSSRNLVIAQLAERWTVEV